MTFPGQDENQSISAETISNAVLGLQKETSSTDYTTVIDAFDVPKIVYDIVSKQFHQYDKPLSILGPAEVWNEFRP